MYLPGTNGRRKEGRNISVVAPRFGSTKLAAAIVRGVLLLIVLAALVLIVAQPAQAQTETVLYNFTGGADGSYPTSTLITDSAGNFYGTTTYGGEYGAGVVFELSPDGSGGWNESVLHSFTGSDGANPFMAPVMFDNAGNLYGTTEFVGGGNSGAVYELSPSGTGWTATTLYGGFGNPASNLVMDARGRLYSTTSGVCAGGLFELSRAPKGWRGRQIAGRARASCGVTMDGDGNLYVARDCVWELSPRPRTWWRNCIYEFGVYGEDGSDPWTAPVLDRLGNIYGTTYSGGATKNGTVYKLTPTRKKWRWTEQFLYSFAGVPDGAMPIGQVVLDAAGNIYGTTQQGGELDYGTVFELVPDGKGSYNETILWSFQGPDGAGPMDSLIMDSAGVLYGTAPGGGSYGAGVVFAVTP